MPGITSATNEELLERFSDLDIKQRRQESSMDVCKAFTEYVKASIKSADIERSDTESSELATNIPQASPQRPKPTSEIYASRTTARPSLIIPNKAFIDGEYDRTTKLLRSVFTHKQFRTLFYPDNAVGYGAEGTCVQWKMKPLGTNKGSVVVKSVHSYQNPIPTEVKIFERVKSFRHANIAEYFTWFDFAEPTRDWILLGYCDLSDACNFKAQYSRRKEKFPEIHVWNIVTQLNSALAFLHEGYGTPKYKNGWLPILHRDVKDSNILLSSGQDLPHARLTDFGFSQVVTSSNFDYDTKYHPYGCAWFHPPERPIAREAGDMWASGATIHTMCLDETPIDCRGEDTQEKLQTIAMAWVPQLERSVIPINIAPHLRRRQSMQAFAVVEWCGTYSDLFNYWMHRLMDFDPGARLTAVEAMETMGKAYDNYMEEVGRNGFEEFVRGITPPDLLPRKAVDV